MILRSVGGAGAGIRLIPINGTLTIQGMKVVSSPKMILTIRCNQESSRRMKVGTIALLSSLITALSFCGNTQKDERSQCIHLIRSAGAMDSLLLAVRKAATDSARLRDQLFPEEGRDSVDLFTSSFVLVDSTSTIMLIASLKYEVKSRFHHSISLNKAVVKNGQITLGRTGIAFAILRSVAANDSVVSAEQMERYVTNSIADNGFIDLSTCTVNWKAIENLPMYSYRKLYGN